jgi:hypothetical protein
VGISRDYPLKTRTSKQPMEEILGYKIIPSHPFKYPRSKQDLTHVNATLSNHKTTYSLRFQLYDVLGLVKVKLCKV